MYRKPPFVKTPNRPSSRLTPILRTLLDRKKCFLTSLLALSGLLSFGQPIVSSSTGSTLLCSESSATLSVNVTDESTYPDIPLDPNVKHYTFQWYHHADAIEAATGPTCTTNVPGIYSVQVSEYSQVFSGSGYAWDDQPSATFTSTPFDLQPAQPNNIAAADFTINGLMSLDVMHFLGCEPLWFAAADASIINHYKIDITDPSFETVFFSTGDVIGSPASVDIGSLCQVGVEGDCVPFSLSEYNGTVGVKFTASSTCISNGFSTAQALIYVSKPPSGNSVEFRTKSEHTTNGDTWYLASNSSISNPDNVGRESTIFNFAGVSYKPSPSICSFSVDLYKWDGSGWGTSLWSNNYTLDCTKGRMAHIPISILGGNGYFSNSTNAPSNSLWRVVSTLYNDCGSYTQEEIFKINDVSFN